MEDIVCCEFGEFEALDREALDMGRDMVWEWETADMYALQDEEHSQFLLEVLG